MYLCEIYIVASSMLALISIGELLDWIHHGCKLVKASDAEE